MRRFPPSVGAVLAMDHNLLGNSTYLEPYPALVAFVNEHPEVIHNPSFFFGNGMGYRVNMDPAERAANTQKDVMGGLAALTAFGPSIGLIVWLIRTFVEHKRWSRQARVQTEFHTKLLDRFSSHDELLAYLQSPAGAKFLSASPIALDSPRTLGSLLGRIMWSAQAGVVLVAVLQSRWPDRVEAPLGARAALCPIGRDVARVAAAIDRAREEGRPQVAVPDAGRVWWVAQMRARREAAPSTARLRRIRHRRPRRVGAGVGDSAPSAPRRAVPGRVAR